MKYESFKDILHNFFPNRFCLLFSAENNALAIIMETTVSIYSSRTPFNFFKKYSDTLPIVFLKYVFYVYIFFLQFYIKTK